MSGWLAFWNRPNRIYVNDTHLRVNYRHVADAILTLTAGAPVVVLDYGCGDALEAERVAAGLRELLLYDAADAVRERLRARHAGAARIAILDEAALSARAPASVDLIVANSVIQYLTREELVALLARSRELLAEGGRLVLADVLPPGHPIATDVAALLRMARREGFFLAAVGGLASTMLSDYPAMRRSLHLSTYSEGDIAGLAAGAGLSSVREARNLGFNDRRMTFTLRPSA